MTVLAISIPALAGTNIIDGGDTLPFLTSSAFLISASQITDGSSEKITLSLLIQRFLSS